MKRFFAIVLAILLVGITSVAAVAAPLSTAKTEVIALENGYATITTTIEETGIAFFASTRKASKIYKAYNSANKLQWSYTLTGEFSYDGNSATAKRAYDSHSISNSAWRKDYSSTSYSGDTVYGDADFSSSVDSLSCSLSITCGANGEIS